MNIIETLRDLLARLSTYSARRAELERQRGEFTSRNDFRLEPAEVAVFAEVLAGIELATRLEKAIKATLDRELKSAAATLGRAQGHVQDLQRKIDLHLVDVVKATLPAGLTIEVVAGNVTPANVFDAMQKANAPAVIHIKDSKAGAAELAERFHPMNAHMRAFFSATSPIEELLGLIDEAIHALELIEKEQRRCEAVLAKFEKSERKKAA